MVKSKPHKRTSIATSSTRRAFLQLTAAASASSLAFPNILRGKSPSETLNVACVGLGGMAGGTVRAPKLRVVAICDVDANILGGKVKQHPEAKAFRDYRRMLDELGKEIDAITIATPDHMHGPIALAAMDLGKHVYCEKPLAHNIAEVRAMTRMAQRKGVITQIGTQIHSSEQYRSAVAALRDGAIGKVSEVHLWINTSWSGPPEKRPTTTDAVPAHLDWELWLGVAPRRPFVSGLYLPYEWRRWKDFGGGTLGDMGCHLFDPVFTALDMSTVISVRSTGPANYEETFAPNGRVEYDLAGTQRTTDPLTMTWSEKVAPLDAAKKHLPASTGLPPQGSILLGDKGMMVIPHIGNAQIYRDGEVVEARVAGIEGVDHKHQWIAACRGEVQTSTPFSFSGPLTEAVLLGTIAGNFKDEKLQWDGNALRFTNSAAATALVGRKYSDGYELPNV